MNKPVLQLRHVSKSFTQAGEVLHILNDANLTLEAGKATALVGPSGSGKTTLLQLAGLLDVPDEGEVVIQEVSAKGLSEEKRTALRRQHIGFVYQFHNLLPEFTALENVMMPLMINKMNTKQAKEEAEALLATLGLADRMTHIPSLLSGGEQQRVAIARAMIMHPALLLADEPTGNLDPHTADSVFALLQGVITEYNSTALVVTHNHALAEKLDQRVTLEEGAIVGV